MGYPLLRQVYLGVSLPLFVAGWRFPSAFVFVSLTPFCCSLLFGVFPAFLLYGYHFLLLCSRAVAVVFCISLNCCPFLPFVGGESLVSSLASSLRSSASLLQCLVGRCAWHHPSIPVGPMCPWDSVACPLPYRLLYIEHVVMVLVHSLPYRTLILW